MKLTSDEKKLVEHAKKAIIKYNKVRKAKGEVDTIYGFVLSDSGKMYDGSCLESSVGASSTCAERIAIGSMVLNESYKAKIKSVVTADPVPRVLKNSTTPCGACRHAIWERGTPNTTIICLQFIKQKDGWTFHKPQKYTIKQLYPNAYEPVKWD